MTDSKSFIMTIQHSEEDVKVGFVGSTPLKTVARVLWAAIIEFFGKSTANRVEFLTAIKEVLFVMDSMLEFKNEDEAKQDYKKCNKKACNKKACKCDKKSTWQKAKATKKVVKKVKK